MPQPVLADSAVDERGSARLSGGTGPSAATAGSHSLHELDTLLQELSLARAAGSGPGLASDQPDVSNCGPVPSQLSARPSVDALLSELDADDPRSGVPPVRPPPSLDPAPAAGTGDHTSASSATRELDHLMACLSDFKVTVPGPAAADTTPEYALPSKSRQLDSMLGNLQQDMDKQGVTTTQKGMCGACQKPIVGQVITALGKTWHKEHFTCAHCREELGTRNFFERDGRPYCETDYHSLFSPRCAYCNGPILDKCVTALEQTWHPEHFFCTHCGQPFGEDGFHERDGRPFCRTDYQAMFAPRCAGCQRPITDNYISALNVQWHPDCFVCKDCRTPMRGKSFYKVDDKPMCAGCVGADDDDDDDEEGE